MTSTPQNRVFLDAVQEAICDSISNQISTLFECLLSTSTGGAK